ncbi:MAG TPA: 3'-5' exonuclease, partial [Marinobacter hydrocarbonoclasticus]|nr:3'-5' exonuclease [Marinobacter nauticus]
MLEYIKQWLARRRGGTVGEHDAANLPSPKTVGDQPLSRSRLIV